MPSFDQSITSQTIAPNLTTKERLNYLVKERELIEEMLERNSLRKRWCHAISTYSSLYESLLFQLWSFAVHDAGNVCCAVKLVELLARTFP
jgi:hypothetical protein